MRILLINNFYQQFGGSDAVALAEKKLLEQNGHAVHFYERHNDEVKGYNFRRQAVAALASIYSWRTRAQLAEIAAAFAPEVAYVHNVYPLISPSAYHVLHKLGIPVVQNVADFRFLCANGFFYTGGKVCERCKEGNSIHAVLRKCYRGSYGASAVYAASIGLNRAANSLHKVDGFVCLTAFARKKFAEAGVPDDRLFVKPNFIDAAIVPFSPGTGEYVLYLGRLSDEKGLWTLIRAFEGLPEVPLRIAGTGPLAAPLQTYVDERKLGNISFAGFVEGEAKKAAIANCWFTIVPSEWYENFPMSILDAFAAAKPVIGSKLGSLPYIIEEGRSGFLFTPGDASDLRRKVVGLVREPGLIRQMGSYARRLAEEKYSPKANYEQLLAIFSTVRDHRHGRIANVDCAQGPILGS